MLEGDRPKARALEQADRRAGKRRTNHPGVLRRAWHRRTLLLLLAQTAGEDRVSGTVRSAETVASAASLELILASGERLRIGNGVDA